MNRPSLIVNIRPSAYDSVWPLFSYVAPASASKAKLIFSGSTAESQPSYSHAPVPTGISREAMQHVGKVLTDMPEDFNLHKTLAKRFIPRRQEALKTGREYDWAFAESLAWGSLLMEGNPVRLSGQDVRRGTFSHRHAVFYDSETRERYIPLKNLSKDQANFCVYNSLLSEAAVLGFDYGYSLGATNMLIMWAFSATLRREEYPGC